jgi:hypothetical protein
MPPGSTVGVGTGSLTDVLVGALIAGMVGALTAGTVGAFTAGTVGTLTAGTAVALATATVGAFTAGTVGAFTAGTVGAFTAGSVGAFTAGTVGAFTAGTVGTFTTGADGTPGAETFTVGTGIAVTCTFGSATLTVGELTAELAAGTVGARTGSLTLPAGVRTLVPVAPPVEVPADWLPFAALPAVDPVLPAADVERAVFEAEAAVPLCVECVASGRATDGAG